MNVPELVLPVPLSALAPKLRTTAANAAPRSVTPARRPPLPQRALPRESPPRVPLPHRALPRSPCRSLFLFTFSPFFRALDAGRSYRNPAERRLARQRTPHPLWGGSVRSPTRGIV